MTHSILYNPYWASSEIHGQLMTHRGKNMVCLAFTQEQEDAMVETIRESDHDYRLTITDGPERHYESRKGGQVSSSYADGLKHRKGVAGEGI